MAETLHCTVVTPEKSIFDAEATGITVPAWDGEVGVLPGHSRLLARLGNGELRIRATGGDKTFYIEGGFLQVADDRVTVLTDSAFDVADIDIDAAEQRVNDLREKDRGEEFAEARRRWLARRRVKERFLRS
ncbi:MAG: ATP synthase F1 subunit epsilon [Gemmatimonadetes bacterium]|nr:ATP synthase F1 subunit epsilon [Gemmatimonadota bacterium]